MSRLALVTGSTSGIGLGIAKVLSAKGYDIILNGLGNTSEVDSALEECHSLGSPQVVHHGADLSDPCQITHLFKFVVDKWKRCPDILINNAGMQYVSSIEDFPPDKWEKIIALNLTASFHTIQHTLPEMRKRGWGRIVNISSTHGLVASPKKSAYVAAKHGIIGLTKVVALETAGSGITSNAVCPGWVLTPLTVPQIEAVQQKKGISFEEAKELIVGEKQPSKELILPEEVGSMVAYLCSNEAGQVTGSTFTIDGGWTAQ